ncbi:Dimer-Tnp-hAT domain-containing protein [Pyrenophora tritici-repentis]|nr:Dimer-Tnp-hAT domain-containing protein [Pyrenophora tritici-repentis]
MEPSTPTSPSPSNIIRLDLTSLTPSPIPTSSPTPILSPTPIQYHESPDEFVQGGITYVKRAIIARKDFRQGINHVDRLIVAESVQYIRDSDKKEVYYCHECRVGKSKQELFVINGTSRIRNHLEQKHQIDPQSGIKRKGSKESVEKFKELLIRWIVYCHIAFFQLENQYFRELLLFLNPALLNHLPKAAKTIRSWVMNAFISKKQQLREDLHHSRSRISISFDLWTSPNPYAILGVVAMWIDTTGMRRVTALGMRRIYGEHTGENLGSVVLELLEEYDISGDQIGYFMLDNASANDTAVEFILKDLCPWMKSKQRRHRRLRCLGHVINLCCQAFLMGRNCEKYLAKLEKHHQRGDYTKVEELWKKFGCLGRLHNLVRYIRLTPQRREEFATIIIGGDLSQFDGLELIQNNSTRWNSWFYSITRALNVRERLELFSARHVPGKGSVGIANFKLDGQHWFELEKIELALKDFYAATLLSEGKKTSLADWFSTLDCLLREISETKDHYHDIHTEDDNNFTWKYLQGCADAAWLKCVEYYNNQQLNWQNRFPEDTDLPPAYYAAQILDPYRKWGWFRQEWVLHGDEEKKRWFENAQLAVKHLWETEYKGRYPVEMLPPPARKERDPDPAFDRQREHKRIRIDAPVSTTDLYEQYISTDRLHNEEAGCNEAIAYWLSRYDSQRDLARFALDMFAISPMSDECERLFSSAKLTIVDRRDQTRPDHSDHWLRPLKQATKRLEGRGKSGAFGAIAEVIPVFEYLLGVYEDRLQSYEDVIHDEHTESPEDHLAINLRAALVKAREYYNKLDLSPAYYAATILHPRYKSYLDAAWADKPDWLESSNRKFQHLWAEYKSLPKSRLRPKVRHNDIDDAINSFIEPAGLTENEEDEYEAWKRSEPIASEGVDPIKYWVGLRDRYPSLSKFAIDMLSIPGSSCECERLFSELGDLLEPRRRSISPQLLAAIQCDRRWIRAGFGSGEVPVKEAISDEEMDAKYGVHKWDIS